MLAMVAEAMPVEEAAAASALKPMMGGKEEIWAGFGQVPPL